MDDVSQRAVRMAAAKTWAPTLYVVLGQVGWFACVESAAHGAPWMGTLCVVALLAAHLRIVARPVEEFKLVLAVVVIGAVWETALVRAGLLAYPSGTIVRGTAPYWIPALWALFAAQLNTSYRWLKTRLALASLFGAIAGPLSFRAGVALGALRFVQPPAAVLALAIGWAVLLPLILLISRRLDGVSQNAA
jgi:hypothetical protein